MPTNSLTLVLSNYSLGFDKEQKNPDSQENSLEPTVLGKSTIELEQQQYHLEMSRFLALPLNAIQGKAMSEFIKLDFIKKNPSDRYDTLYKLSRNPKFIAFLEKDPMFSYILLIQSVANEPDLVTKLRKIKELGNFIVKVEIEDFPKEFADWLQGKTFSYPFSYALYHHLSPNFFTKNKQERLVELVKLKGDAEFINALDLGASELGNLADKFLRRSVDHDPEYLKILLDSTDLWVNYLLRTELDTFHNEFNEFMKSDYSIAFTDPLYTMLPLNYFVCDNQERCTILQDTRFHPLFLWHLKSDLVAAKQFLKLSVGQEAALLEELDAHRLGRFLRSPSQTDQNATMLQQEEVLEEHPESKPQHKTRKRPQTAITEQESTLSACLRLSKHPVFGNAAVKQKDGPPTFQYN